MAKKRGNPNWKKGERPPGAAPLWKPGQTGNPGGKPKGLPTHRTRAIAAMTEMLDRVMREPEIMESVEKQFRRAITSNAPKALREYILPFAPTFTATQTEDAAGNIIRRLSVQQLEAIVSEGRPSDPVENAKPVDNESDATD